jgi:hypothetical protein
VSIFWIILITIALNLFSSCEVQPSLSEDEDVVGPSSLPDEKLEDEQPNLFQQDRNKSYSQIGRPWVLAKPLLEQNKSYPLSQSDE